MENSYHCDMCDKNYKTYQTLWKHNKKFHSKNIINLSSSYHQKDDKLPSSYHQKDDNLSSSYHHLSSSVTLSKKTDRKNCNFCNKTYSCYKNMFRHEKVCKKNPKNNTEIIPITTEITPTNTNTILNNINEKILEILNKNKVNKKTINEINNMLSQMHTNNNTTNNTNTNTNTNNTNSHNTTNNSHNTTNNINNNNVNNINIIQLGKENLNNLFTQKEKIDILNKTHSAILELIEKAHFNPKYPELHSIILTNQKTNSLYLYNEDKKIFKLTNKDEAIDLLIECKVCDIEDFYEENKNILSENVKKTIETIIDDRYDNDEKPIMNKQIRNDINHLLYNNRNTVKHLVK